MTAGRSINTLSQEWGTPQIYVDAVREFFSGKISLDPCSNRYSVVHAQVEYILPKNNGLKDSWDFSTIYVNPPYGSDKQHGTTIKSWLRRCAQAHQIHNSEVIALVPVAPNTAHWKDFVFGRAAAICFLYDTRLKFLEKGRNGGKGAPMACAMIYWGENVEKFDSIFSKFGAVADITNLKGKNIAGFRKSEIMRDSLISLLNYS